MVKAEACSAGVRLPCILKDAAACGVPEAHRMSLILGWQGLEGKLFRPCLLQNFMNHDGHLYKVYVLDSLVSLQGLKLCKHLWDRLQLQSSLR